MEDKEEPTEQTQPIPNEYLLEEVEEPDQEPTAPELEVISRVDLMSEFFLGTLGLKSTHLTITELRDVALELLKNEDVRNILMLGNGSKTKDEDYLG